MEEGDGGTWKVSLGFTNLTEKSITLAAKPKDAGDIGCRLILDHERLPPAEHSAVNVTVPAGCKVAKDGIDFAVSARVTAASPSTFEVTAAPKPDTNKPEWSALWAFPLILSGHLGTDTPRGQPLQILRAQPQGDTAKVCLAFRVRGLGGVLRRLKAEVTRAAIARASAPRAAGGH